MRPAVYHVGKELVILNTDGCVWIFPLPTLSSFLRGVRAYRERKK